ncbi:MAG: hypothetical protein R2932_04075 [Caldilineaceae bacterium]
MLLNAWIVDDAYITFRTVDNFVHGYGLTWNPAERVQVYTHPLWMFLVAACYAVTSELFFTVIALSLVLTLAAWAVAWHIVTCNRKNASWYGVLLTLALLASKALIDYASSGLESPLSYLLIALFIVNFSTPPATGIRDNQRRVALLFFIAALAFVNRADTILLYLPPLVYLLYQMRALPNGRLSGILLFATAPAMCWLLFSLIY